MAQDRFITFGRRRPTVEETIQIAKDYLSDAGTIKIEKAEKSRTWVTCGLFGKPQHPLRSIVPNVFEREDERWFEIFINKKRSKKVASIIVTTRMADNYTNAVADGYVGVISRYYEAIVEHG